MKEKMKAVKSKKMNLSVGGMTFNKWRNPLHRVGGKLFLIYFISITLIVSGVGYFSYTQSALAIERKVSATASQTIGLAAEKVETEIKAYRDITMQLIADPDLLKMIQDIWDPNVSGYDHYKVQNDLEKKLSLVALWKDGLRNVSILPLNAEKGLRGKNYSGVPLNDSPIQEKWFQQVVAENGKALFLSTREKGYYASDKPAFGIARLIIDGSTGKKLGILLLEIGEDVLESAVGSISFGKNAGVMVLDQENQLVRAHDPKEMGKKGSIAFSDQEKEAAAKSTVSTVRDGRLVIYKTLSITDWVVASAIPMADLMRETEQIRNFTIFMVLIAILIAVILGVWVLKMVGDPLNRLRVLMQQAEEGNLTVRLESKRKDEIGEVSRSFNHMMEGFSSLIQEVYQNSVTLMKHAESLHQSSKNTAVSAKDLASATEEIAQGAGQLASEAERGINLTQEMKSRMAEVEEANRLMGMAVTDVEEASRLGSDYMMKLTDKTAAQEEKTKQMVDKIWGLKKSMESVREVLEILQGITKQTNILSLNATIEAARAGEAGKGFAVVADQIRRLADQSRQSIEVVGKTADRIDREIFLTMEAVGEATALFQEQIASVREGDALFNQVNEKMAMLRHHLNEVMNSQKRLDETQHAIGSIMEVMNGFSEESSASSEEVASIGSSQLEISNTLVEMSESLERLSHDLEVLLTRFKVQ